MSAKGDRQQGVRHLRRLLAAVGGEAQRQGAGQENAGDDFRAAANCAGAGAGGAQDVAGLSAQDLWRGGEGY